MHFSYGRELLKIIRRIIKCHPSQGQQFGTQHLLVTYSMFFYYLLLLLSLCKILHIFLYSNAIKKL
jgi:hypothetical protein